jgi:hypothetical protein
MSIYLFFYLTELSKREREGRQMVKVGGKKEMIARSV